MKFQILLKNGNETRTETVDVQTDDGTVSGQEFSKILSEQFSLSMEEWEVVEYKKI